MPTVGSSRGPSSSTKLHPSSSVMVHVAPLAVMRWKVAASAVLVIGGIFVIIIVDVMFVAAPLFLSLSIGAAGGRDGASSPFNGRPPTVQCDKGCHQFLIGSHHCALSLLLLLLRGGGTATTTTSPRLAKSPAAAAFGKNHKIVAVVGVISVSVGIALGVIIITIPPILIPAAGCPCLSASTPLSPPPSTVGTIVVVIRPLSSAEIVIVAISSSTTATVFSVK